MIDIEETNRLIKKSFEEDEIRSGHRIGNLSLDKNSFPIPSDGWAHHE